MPRSSRSDEPLSRPLREVCPHVFETVARVCVRDEDLEAIGLLREPPAGCPVPPAVWGRVLLQRLHHLEPRRISSTLAGRLDVRHAEDVLAVRREDPLALQERADDLLARGDGPAAPGFLWAVATDPRPEVRRIAARLGFSLSLLACRVFVESAPDDPPSRTP